MEFTKPIQGAEWVKVLMTQQGFAAMTASRLGLLSLLLILLASGCTPAAQSAVSPIKQFDPHPPAWLSGSWEGKDDTGSLWLKVNNGGIPFEEDVSPKGSIGVTLRDYRQFSDCIETIGENFYELQQESRYPPYKLERFTLNSSGSIDYLATGFDSATRSFVLVKIPPP